MFYWSSFPFVRILIPFILGITLARLPTSAVFETNYVWVLLFCLLVIFVLSYFQLKSFRHRWLSGIIANFLFILVGWQYATFYISSTKPPEINSSAEIKWSGSVTDVSYSNGIVKSFVVEVGNLNSDSISENVRFNLLVYNRDSSLIIQPSDLVAASSYIKPTIAPQNPSQFNYQQFLRAKEIYYTTFEDEFIADRETTSIVKLAHKCRVYMVNIYKKIGINGDELSVLTALTLGDKSQLSFDLKKGYAGAGAMHILAVSGLHVGIVFLLFSQIFKLFPDKKAFRLLEGFSLLVVIWLFAFLAGLSPSVQRASWMFSFVIVSKMFNRQSNIINSIAASAFLLVLINPNVIYQIGFVLSYSAVLGIILIHPVIYNWVTVRYKFFDKIWSLLAVSIAAQLATLPITLYFFHQFPNWFLLTNLIVIPAAFAVVAGSILCVFLYLVFKTTLLLGKVLMVILQFLNWSVISINDLPFAISDGIWIATISFLLLSLIVWTFVAYLNTAKVKLLFTSLLLLLSLLVIETYLDYKQLTRKEIVFYALREPSFSFINGLKGEVFFTGNSKEYDLKLMKDHLNSLGISIITMTKIDEKQKFIAIEDKVIYWNKEQTYNTDFTEKIDFVINSKNVVNSHNFNPTLIDYVFRNKKDFEDLSERVNYHNVKSEGALVVKIP